MLVAAIPALALRLGLPDGSSEPEDSTQYQAYTITAEEFGAGRNGTLVVTAEPGTPVDARILPNVDVEGASLERDAAASSALHGHR